jgi:Tfp pilus assembly protein PilF
MTSKRSTARQLSAALALAVLGGCASLAIFQGKGGAALSAGIQQFEEGRYPEATRSLNSALEQGLETTADLARAHKYLAFIHCASNRVQQCRDEFGKALDANPSMQLDPNEAGHPVWGPAFKAAKSRRPA